MAQFPCGEDARINLGRPLDPDDPLHWHLPGTAAESKHLCLVIQREDSAEPAHMVKMRVGNKYRVNGGGIDIELRHIVQQYIVIGAGIE